MAPAVKADEAAHPIQLSLLGADAVMFDANLVAHLIEQARLLRRNRRILGGGR